MDYDNKSGSIVEANAKVHEGWLSILGLANSYLACIFKISPTLLHHKLI